MENFTESSQQSSLLPHILNKLNEEALQYLDTDPAQGIALIEEVFQRHNVSDEDTSAYPGDLAGCFLTLGRLHMKIANYGEALNNYAQALHFYELSEDAAQIALTRSYIGVAYAHMGEFAEGLEHLFAALRGAQEAGDRFMVAEITNDISYCYVVLGQPELALEHLHQAIVTLRELGDKVRLAWALDSLGTAYLRTGDAERGLEYEQECIQLAEEMQSWQDLSYYLSNIGEMQQALNNHAAAEEMYLRALEVARKHNFRAEVATALLNLGRLHINQGRLGDGLPKLVEAYAICDDTQRLAQKMECCQTMADAYEKAGDFTKALDFYKKFNAAREALYNEEADRRMKNLQVMHQLETARREAAEFQEKNLALQQEIEAQKRNHAVLERMARTDALTNVLNRRAFFETGQQLFQQSRSEGNPLTVVMLDLDHFKKVNDQYGHLAGDQTLAVLTERLRHHLRMGDALARYGGEEFVILLPGVPGDQALITAERLRMAVNVAPFLIRHTILRVTISLGVATAEHVVLRVVPVEEDHPAVALEGQDVRGDAVQEPAVVADDHGAAGEVLQGLFQGAHGVHVQVVGRLVQQQHVGPSLSIRARCTRLRSPPESMPTFFCWSAR
jgi:diguanylate cyclase (GGDEF)-like protein